MKTERADDNWEVKVRDINYFEGTTSKEGRVGSFAIRRDDDRVSINTKGADHFSKR